MSVIQEIPEIAPEEVPARGGIVRGSLARMAFLIALGWLGTNLGLNIGELVLKFFLKEDMGQKADAIAAFFFFGQFTNYIKPLAGLCTDSIPLFKTRRRHYLILSLLGTGLFFLLLVVVPRSYSLMLFVYIFLYMTVVFTSTTLGGVMVEVGMQHRAEGRLTAQRIGMFRLGTLAGAPIGGLLVLAPLYVAVLCPLLIAQKTVPFTPLLEACRDLIRLYPLLIAMGATAFLHLVLVPLFYVYLPEAPTARMNTGIWQEAARQAKTLVKSRTLLSAALMICLIAASPGFNTPLLFHQTDVLHFNAPFIGLLASLSAGTGFLATIVYFAACRNLSLRVLVASSIVVHAAGTLLYVYYHSAQSALIITALTGITGTLAMLPVYDLACRATPRGSEAIGYSIMMSVWNLTNGLSDYTGSRLFAKFHFTFLNLVWLNAGTTALVLLIVPFLPAALMDRHDAGSSAKPLKGKEI